MIHVLRSGWRWRDMPASVGRPNDRQAPVPLVANPLLAGSVRDAARGQSNDAHCIIHPQPRHTGPLPTEKGGGPPKYRPFAGGRGTRIHRLTDGRGRPVAFQITAGQLGDIRAVLPITARMPPGRMCLADTAHDAGRLEQPDESGRPYDQRLYRGRNRAKRTSGHLEDWQRIATRYDPAPLPRRAFHLGLAVAPALFITWRKRNATRSDKTVDSYRSMIFAAAASLRSHNGPTVL